MAQDSEYTISAGEFARLCKTTRDTLRYYDKMGILVPKKNDENGYHYYSYGQITSFYFINFFRAIDCPVKDLKSYLHESNVEEFYSFLDSQYDMLLNMKRELDSKVSVLSGAIYIINNMKKNPDGKVLLEKSELPIRVKLTKVESSPANSSIEISTDITRHIDLCNQCEAVRTFPMGGVIDKEGFFNNDYSYKYVFSIAENYCVERDIVTLPSQTVVSCVNRDSTESTRSVYKRIQKYLEENNLTARSDIYSLSMVNILDTNDERRFLKYIFVCV